MSSSVAASAARRKAGPPRRLDHVGRLRKVGTERCVREAERWGREMQRWRRSCRRSPFKPRRSGHLARDVCDLPAGALGEAMVGRRVFAFWEADKCWYSGVVRGWRAQDGAYDVVYDDGEEQWEQPDIMAVVLDEEDEEDGEEGGEGDQSGE